MDRIVKNKIFMNDARRFKRVFLALAGAFTFASIYLVLMSGVTDRVECLLSVFIGAAAVGVFLAFGNSKSYVKYAVIGVAGLYAVLSVAIGFNGFVNGLYSFINHAARRANETMHYGFASVLDAEESVGGNFLFCSVLSALLGLGAAAVINRSVIAYLFSCAVLTLLWLCLGLFPEPYAIVLFVFSFLVLLIAYREFAFKSVLSYLGIAAVLFAALSPCFFYTGSEGVSDFKSSVGSTVEHLLYGTDSLPEGDLKKASGMRAEKDERLRVTLSGGVRNLYLRGFVGSELDGSEWRQTDKNVYVSDGYQGLLDYVGDERIPFEQYARYSALGGNANDYGITVNNMGANRKYLYLPYTVVSCGSGKPNYDMNVHARLTGSKSYSFGVFAADRSSEVVQQARWLGNESLQTEEMKRYIAVEGQYRNFAYATYSAIDEETAALVRNAVGIQATGEKEKINPAANFIRNYFRTKFEYSDTADPVNDDFLSEFFGGEIKKATAAYFASAATVAFRAYGYAARYAEGYLVYADEGETEVSVTGNYAHAWTEVYFDGMGWLPVEVTPGFFTTLTEIDPDDPDLPPVDPVKPPDEGNKPTPSEPVEKPEPDLLTPEEHKILLTLKILMPFAVIALAALTAVLTVLVRRVVLIDRKRKKLNEKGEAYGRAVYGIMQRDFGERFAEEVARYGIKESATERFVELVEKSVYGGYDLSEGERKVVKAYIESVSEAYFESGGKWHKFVCRYFKCIGI